jgi:Zn-finger nucleic acid-binding protein
MELFERRKYFFCRYCGSFHFIETGQAAGVQVLDRSGTLPCPVCASSLAGALLDTVHPIQYCERCRGVLLPRSVFVDATATRRAFAISAPIPPAPLDQRELERHVPCPKCRRAMDVHPYYGPGNVVMDTCTPCNLIWLDFGELEQIVDAPGKDRGTRQIPAPPPDQGDNVPVVERPKGVSLIEALAEFLMED